MSESAKHIFMTHWVTMIGFSSMKSRSETITTPRAEEKARHPSKGECDYIITLQAQMN